MPLLKRKRLPEINVPSLESGEKGLKNKQVWYLPMSNEIFLDYEYPFYRKQATHRVYELYRMPTTSSILMECGKYPHKQTMRLYPIFTHIILDLKKLFLQCIPTSLNALSTANMAMRNYRPI